MLYRFRSVPSSMPSCRDIKSDPRIGPYLTKLSPVPAPLIASPVSCWLVGPFYGLAQLGG